ncbi:AAA family ATPase [Hoylesella timonensis 4401737 = DSM 22865 = JCM 15640]|uniref:AAA family ATPase n=1 Tax=Hoylesella timonensis TaxID=386414 RepID=UPI0004210276|nr:AAA family ATPase [Hoylesella timonensis]
MAHGIDIEKIDLNNQELQNALQLVQFTHRSLFLTGKAGTGKSTFLHYIAQTTKKKYVILAPTGIAAINVGGATLHSFFKLPFHPLLPNDRRYSTQQLRNTLKYNSEKIKLIRELELIIIDEISMVRADIIDFIDKILRVYSHNMRIPFGGKQLLLVGDVYQLEPVLKEEDWQLLQPYYPSKFFFDAHVFRTFQLVCIELQKVYRQRDDKFISILDHIRTSTITTTDLSLLNQQVGQHQPMDAHQLSITLSTRRDTVDYINSLHLSKLPGDATILHGSIDGEYPENNLPTPIELEVKTGAQILFIKNDREKRWVNGTLGTIIGIGDEEDGKIYVRTEQGEDVDVEQEVWNNVRYTYNQKEQKVEEEILGSFQQFPLRLAWAITIHKSQGLTFNQVKIDLSGGVFAGGQTYVALSRCRSLKGIALQEPVKREDIYVNQEVVKFSKTYNDPSALNTAIQQSKADKQYHDATKAFDRGDMQAALDYFYKAIHSRYDIEKPEVKRLIRRKLNIINLLREQNKQLQKEKKDAEAFLKELSTEYVIMGKDCEKEGMTEAAIRNYQKALKLYPTHPQALKRLKKLNG